MSLIQESVLEVFGRLDRTLGRECFERLFPVLLGDNGSEFSNPAAIEVGGDGEPRTRLFYCDPRCSFQKPHVENNHDFIRRCLPKGGSMNHLTQKDIDKMMSHINSYRRRSLAGLSPTDLFVKAYGADTLKKLGMWAVAENDIVLTPKLFEKQEVQGAATRSAHRFHGVALTVPEKRSLPAPLVWCTRNQAFCHAYTPILPDWMPQKGLGLSIPVTFSEIAGVGLH
jgi:hypothetical protein